MIIYGALLFAGMLLGFGLCAILAAAKHDDDCLECALNNHCVSWSSPDNLQMGRVPEEEVGE